jgi:hypothetical protein
MQEPKYQFEAEDQIIRENLDKAGYFSFDVEDMLKIIKDKSPDKKIERCQMIRVISEVLRGNICALQSWYVHNLLAKICGFTPSYIKRISYTMNPEDIYNQKR